MRGGRRMTLLLGYRAEKMERAVAFTRRATRRATRCAARRAARRAVARRAAACRGPPGGNSANWEESVCTGKFVCHLVLPDAAQVAPLVRRRSALHHEAPVRRRSALQRSRNSCSSSSSSDESYLPDESPPFFCSPPFFHRLCELHVLREIRQGAENGNWASERRHSLCPRVSRQKGGADYLVQTERKVLWTQSALTVSALTFSHK